MIFILRDHHSRPRLGLTRRAAPISCRPSFSDTGEARAVCEARALESASGFPPSRAGRLLTDKAAPISSSHAQAGVRRRRGRSPGREASQTAAIRLAVSQSVGRAVWRMHGRWRAAFAHPPEIVPVRDARGRPIFQIVPKMYHSHATSQVKWVAHGAGYIASSLYV